jgi:hypothetical protein
VRHETTYFESGKTEVTDFDAEVLIDKHVVALEVSVHNA